MTCIVGLIAKDGTIYMGGDSAGVARYDLVVRKDPKVFVRSPYIFGFSGSFRLGQLIQYKLTLPDPPTDSEDDHKFMVTKFVDALRKCLKDAGSLQKDDGVESAEGSFLVGFRGNLYNIECDFQVGISATPYAAVGCGESIALGAMAALEELSDPCLGDQEKILIALKAAERFNAGVRAPFVVEKISSDVKGKRE